MKNKHVTNLCCARILVLHRRETCTASILSQDKTKVLRDFVLSHIFSGFEHYLAKQLVRLKQTATHINNKRTDEMIPIGNINGEGVS